MVVTGKGIGQFHFYPFIMSKNQSMREIIIFSSALILSLSLLQSCQPTGSALNNSTDNIDSLRTVAMNLAASNDTIARHLQTFDELVYEVFSNQQWHRFKESHAQDLGLMISKDIFSAIDCSVLVMAGELDQNAPLKTIIAAYGMLPTSQLSIIPAAPHSVFLVNFPAVWASIVPFLNP